MAQIPWIDPSKLDPGCSVLPVETIRSHLPQRHEFEMLDRICLLDREERVIAAFKDLSPGDWWARGHFPGKPTMPGILMVEGAAQTATVLWKEILGLPPDMLIGFGGLESVRFRGRVVPPQRIWFISQGGRFRSRMAKLPAQAIVNGKVVFEATILGVAL